MKAVAIALIAGLFPAVAEAADPCEPSPDFGILSVAADRAPGPFLLGPMRCSNDAKGIYCGSYGSKLQVTVMASFVGANTGGAAADKVSHCSADGPPNECLFAIDIDPETIEAGRNAGSTGWGLISIRAGRIDLVKSLTCP